MPCLEDKARGINCTGNNIEEFPGIYKADAIIAEQVKVGLSRLNTSDIGSFLLAFVADAEKRPSKSRESGRLGAFALSPSVRYHSRREHPGAAMPKEERRVLSEEEKIQLLSHHSVCYICNAPFAGYDRTEIEFDHIYNYADGHRQDISNFAPVHASKVAGRLNCHSAKGRKSPVEYREELRIRSMLATVQGLSSLSPAATPSTFEVSADKKSITINGVRLPLYNQRIGGRDNFYFFHEVETKFIENDDLIQLRPLEPKIVSLVFNLKTSVQLLPSLARIDPITKTIRLFDGQHKAVAQIVGNNRDRIMCIVFVDPDVNALRITVYEAHTDYVQQRYKKSHIDAKLADIYAQKIEAFRKRVGNDQAPYSEEDILSGESAASIRKFLLSSIIREVNAETNFITQYGAEGRTDQKVRPVLWQSIERLVSAFCSLQPTADLSESENNYRSDEIDNLAFLLTHIEDLAIRGKWDPENPASEYHKLARTYFYRTAFNAWSSTLEEALRFAFEQMKGSKYYGALCYQPSFSADVRKRFSEIIKRLFEHPLWIQPVIQDDISKSNQDSVVVKIFEREGLDYIHLTRL